MAKDPTQVDKITLIHLQNSSSQSILWLLEELQIDYDIRKYSRPGGKGPPELKDTHPQAKAPQLLIPGGRVLSQSSAIALYLIRTYDKENRFQAVPGSSEDDPVREQHLIALGQMDITFCAGTKLMLLAVSTLSPWIVRPVLMGVRKKLDTLLLDPDLTNAFDVMEGELEGRNWFMGGNSPTRTDFLVRFCVDMAVQSQFIDVHKYPNIKAWLDRCHAREGWKRSLEKGNGYDLQRILH